MNSRTSNKVGNNGSTNNGLDGDCQIGGLNTAVEVAVDAVSDL